MFDILRKRRSIRKYLDKEIEPETIDLLKEAALRSPTSRGIKPWRFIFITDRELLIRLSKAKEHGSSFLGDARLGVVVCAYEDESDVWIEDCSIASIILQLAGQSLGLGSCWIQIRNRMYSDSLSSEDYIRARIRRLFQKRTSISIRLFERCINLDDAVSHIIFRLVDPSPDICRRGLLVVSIARQAYTALFDPEVLCLAESKPSFKIELESAVKALIHILHHRGEDYLWQHHSSRLHTLLAPLYQAWQL